MRPTDLSRYLRQGSDPELRRRRGVVALSLLGVTMGQAVAAFQTGLIGHLPDPPGPFHSDRVDASEYAYKRLQTPDGLPMIATYAMTGTLAAAGGPDRPRSLPYLPLALAAKALFDVVTTVELAREEWAEYRALCAYGLVATAASIATLALAIPDARRALATVRGR